MTFQGFTASDFNVFKIDGLEPRMEALQERIRPKLTYLGDYFSQELSILIGDEIFPHVAKHARRTINPPNDTWVAFAANKRGYKMLPHFQIGLWETHLFIWYAVIYEAPSKETIGKKLQKNISYVQEQVPANFVWALDHMKPISTPHQELSEEDLNMMFERLQTVKKAELLCGIEIPREDAVKMTGEELMQTIRNVFNQLIPLYKLD
ncbi:YktB family protein [Bacillus sp. JJ722]|uniref:YktB family protein n=1 Tax=Bacillus sp. JJ722 TaxID=3122973 RepID=UPI002FFDBE8A